jgi:hypothetical protein
MSGSLHDGLIIGAVFRDRAGPARWRCHGPAPGMQAWRAWGITELPGYGCDPGTSAGASCPAAGGRAPGQCMARDPGKLAGLRVRVRWSQPVGRVRSWRGPVAGRHRSWPTTDPLLADRLTASELARPHPARIWSPRRVEAGVRRIVT